MQEQKDVQQMNQKYIFQNHHLIFRKVNSEKLVTKIIQLNHPWTMIFGHRFVEKRDQKSSQGAVTRGPRGCVGLEDGPELGQAAAVLRQ